MAGHGTLLEAGGSRAQASRSEVRCAPIHPPHQRVAPRGAYTLTADAVGPDGSINPIVQKRSGWKGHTLVVRPDVPLVKREKRPTTLATTHRDADTLLTQAVRVEGFGRNAVRDIVVRNRMCHVLSWKMQEEEDAKETGEKEAEMPSAFTAEIHRSSDLKAWTRVASFDVPAMPNSLEELNGVYYVGLSNPKPWRKASPASGSIWRVE